MSDDTPKRDYKYWSPEQDYDVLNMKPADVAARYGRTIRSVYERRRYLHRFGPAHNIVSNRLDIPEAVLSERDLRLQIAPRDQTASFCGDPLPGYSALDKYKRDIVSA